MVIQIIKENRIPNRGQQFGAAIGGAMGSLGGSYKDKLLLDEENDAIERETGTNLKGIRDPQTRSSIMQDQMKRGQRYRQALASHELHANQDYGQQNISSPKMSQRGQSFQDQLGQGQRGQRVFQERLQAPGIQDQERDPDIGITERPYEEEPTNRLGTARERGQKKTEPARQPQQRSQGGRTLEPQAATLGEEFPRLNPDQIHQKTLQMQEASLRTPNALPLTYEEAQDKVLTNQNNIDRYNQGLQKERDDKEQHQIKYGKQAIDSMESLIPKSQITDEHRAYFQKLGEEAAANNVNQSDFKKQVAEKATEFANDIENIQKGVKPSRLFNDIKGGFWGNNRTAEERKADMRIAIEPLKKLGFYDTIRATLQGGNLKYAPEEIESLLSDLSESTTKTLTDLPDFNKGSVLGGYLSTAAKVLSPIYRGLGDHVKKELEMLNPKEFSQEQLSSIKNNLKDIFSKDPSTNLLLLRKAYEDKGVDWRTFKNQMNNMIMSGELKLNPDQLKQFNSYIMDPPEGPLSYILRQANFIGR